MALFSRGNTPAKVNEEDMPKVTPSTKDQEEPDSADLSFFRRLRVGKANSNSPSRPLPGQIRRETPEGEENRVGTRVSSSRGPSSSGDDSPRGLLEGVFGRSSSNKEVQEGTPVLQKPGFVAGLLGGRTPLSFRSNSGSSNSSSNSNSSSQETRTLESRPGGNTQVEINVAGDVPSAYDSESPRSDGTSTPTLKKGYHERQFEEVILQDNVDLKRLRTLSWNGVPTQYRPVAWQLMLGYLPSNRGRREAAIAKKRKEYQGSVELYFDKAGVVAGAVVPGHGGNYHGKHAKIELKAVGERELGLGAGKRTQEEIALHRQILVDLPRTTPDLPFFHHKPIQCMMERILYIWSLRHPASGYVQGMNDLLTPLLLTATQPYVAEIDPPTDLLTVVGAAAASNTPFAVRATTDILRLDVATLGPQALTEIEADSYWLFCKLLDNVQDHYTFSQPGLQRMVMRLEDVTKRHCPELYAHLQEEGILFMQFAFRWMNCVLLRELPLRCILRLWDAYFAEERNGFENFHVYVCAVIMKMHEDKLLSMAFQEIIIFLQDLPTRDWTDADVEPILSQAFILSTLYDQSGHL